MNNKLLIEILEVLEETYPQDMSIDRLKRRLKSSKEKDFNQVMEYLRETNKITLRSSKGGVVRGKINRPPLDDERVKITTTTIDYLRDMKLLVSREKMDRTMKWATIVIAAAMILNLLLLCIKSFPSS